MKNFVERREDVDEKLDISEALPNMPNKGRRATASGRAKAINNDNSKINEKRPDEKETVEKGTLPRRVKPSTRARDEDNTGISKSLRTKSNLLHDVSDAQKKGKERGKPRMDSKRTIKGTIVGDGSYVEALTSKLIASKEQEEGLKETEITEGDLETTTDDRHGSNIRRGHEHLSSILKKKGKVRLAKVNEHERVKTKAKKTVINDTEQIDVQDRDSNNLNSPHDMESGVFTEIQEDIENLFHEKAVANDIGRNAIEDGEKREN